MIFAGQTNSPFSVSRLPLYSHRIGKRVFGNDLFFLLALFHKMLYT